jgi:hypothetical protein
LAFITWLAFGILLSTSFTNEYKPFLKCFFI